MKRLQIRIERDLDGELEWLAVSGRTSKAALIRQFVRERIRPLPPLSADPLFRMVGVDDVAPAPVDDVVYSRATSARQASTSRGANTPRPLP